MQNKNKQNQIQKDVRQMHERLGALVLIVGTLLGLIGVSDEARRVLSGLALRPAAAIIEHSERGSETAREDVRLDTVLRATFVSGN
jgi:hypothetical protein